MSSHYAVDQKKWAKLSIFDQMGNIYSEVGRSFNAQRRDNPDDRRAAMNRAINLFDATIDALSARNSPQAKEVLRAKQEYLAAINDDNATDESVRSLDRYFMQFAIAARLNR